MSRPLAPLGPLSGVLSARPAAPVPVGGTYLGGMRRPSATIHLLAERDRAASTLQPILVAAVRQAPELVRFITGLLQGGPAPPASAPAPVATSTLAALRIALCRAAGVAPPSSPSEPGLQSQVFRAFAACSGDPDTVLPEWIEQGAPMGILRPVVPSGVFPPAGPARHPEAAAVSTP